LIPHRAQSLVRLCLSSVKGTIRHQPRLHPQAQGTGVLRAIDKFALIPNPSPIGEGS
jgi:hypothetical protein